MRKRLIVTGGGGFVAGSVIRQAGGAWEVHALSRHEVRFQRAGLVWYVFDLCDGLRLRKVFDDVNPDAVIHAAAKADIDWCEGHRDVAEGVNVGVTTALADLCRARGARLVFISTDTVFGGEKGNYNERDAPRPVNFYAETKVWAENVVAATVRNWVVARLSLVMGLPVLGTGNSFLSRMVESFEQGREVGVPDDEIRTPIDIITAGRALLELAGNDYTGCLHLAGNDRLNRFEMVRRLAARLGYPPDLVVAKTPVGIPGRAPRPRDVSLDNTKACGVLCTPMLSLDDGTELMHEARRGTV